MVTRRLPALFLASSGDSDSTGTIRVGMPVRAVANVLQIDAPPRAFSGSITWGRSGRLVRVRFVQGKVVGVEEGHVPLPVNVNKVEPDPE